MKKLSFVTILGLMAVFLLTGNTQAVTFSLSEAALLQLWEVNEAPINLISTLSLVTDDPDWYGGGGMIGSVGFVGQLFSQPGNPTRPFAMMQVGANSTGVSPTLSGYLTSGATTAEIIGLSLGTTPTNSLLGFDKFSMVVANDNDDDWMICLYLNTGSGEVNQYQTSWITVVPGTTIGLSIDLTGVSELNNVTNIGFKIGANLTGQNGNPSNPDTFHFSSSPVPEMNSLVLLGFGLVGLIGWGKFGLNQTRRN